MGERWNDQMPESSGELVFDEHEGAWHCRVRADLCTSDTVTICRLSDEVAAQLRACLSEPQGFDPYSTVDTGIHQADAEGKPQGRQRGSRRTLDDMRRLSDEIKRARSDGSPRKGH